MKKLRSAIVVINGSPIIITDLLLRVKHRWARAKGQGQGQGREARARAELRRSALAKM